MTAPNLANHITAFLSSKNWYMVEVGKNVLFPESDINHPVLYNVVSYFCLAFGAVQMIILGVRVALHDFLDRIGGTLSGVAFWRGIGSFAVWMIRQYLTS